MTNKKSNKTKDIPGFIKGYDINWLKENPDHPDYHLVAEKENGQEKEEEQEEITE